MSRKNRKKRKVNYYLRAVIGRIQDAIRAAGYEPEAIVPLANTFSVCAIKDGVYFNVRVDKDSLEIVTVERLEYLLTRDNKKIRKVSRKEIT